jgi:hypothetical protein
MVGIAILAIIVYVVGVPTVIVGSLVYANQHDFLRDPTWLSCMGDNYLWYGMHLQLLRVRSKLRWPACRESSCVSRVVPREKNVCARARVRARARATHAPLCRAQVLLVGRDDIPEAMLTMPVRGRFSQLVGASGASQPKAFL